MNLDNVHTPQRLEGESQAQYQGRRRMSRRLYNLHAREGVLIFSPRGARTQHTNIGKRERRRQMALVGTRQYRLSSVSLNISGG